MELNPNDSLLEVLPKDIYNWVKSQDLTNLYEIVIDLECVPEIRTFKNVVRWDSRIVSQRDLDCILNHRNVGSFSSENRAVIHSSLHRISAILNQSHQIVGLTLRVGKPVIGCASIIKDLLEAGDSILILGKPGQGKTTLLRDCARILSELDKRVVIVDSSNEIGGEGNRPHISVGRSRRMMVPSGKLQADVMIEAVKNHTPETIIVDEISTFKEAQSVRAISQRGVQILATTHGSTIDDLIDNDPITPIIGEIKAVTVGDKTAEADGTSKTRLERKSLPAFNKVIEILDFNLYAVHHDTALSIDCLLSGGEVAPEIREYKNGNIVVRQKMSYSTKIFNTDNSKAKPEESKVSNKERSAKTKTK